MQAIGDFFTWLFGTRTGVIALVIGGIFLCLIIAMLMDEYAQQEETLHFRWPSHCGECRHGFVSLPDSCLGHGIVFDFCCFCRGGR